MPPAPVSYRLDDTAAGLRALEMAARKFAGHRQTADTRTTTYYDTFDWRVYRRGTVLKTRSDGQSRLLSWARIDGTELQRAPISEKPGFVWDLPEGALRKGLTRILDIRRLLPLFALEARVEKLHVLDDRRKTVARAQLERLRAHPLQGAGETVDLPIALRVLPVKGYDKHFKALVRVFADAGLEPFDTDEFTIATAAVGLQPGSYSRKLDLQLEPAQRSDEALEIILKRLLEVIEQNEEGLRHNLDSEFLHDFRVAVRRTRSALTQLKGVLPPAAVDHFKKEFSWLGQITGPTRDLDVYLLKMPVYRASLPAHLGADLDPLQDFLIRHQQTEHRDLVQLLDTERYRSLLTDWQHFLDLPLSAEADRPEGATAILDLASRRIWHSSRRVMKKGAAIEPETPATALHRLRIECKKLRYLLEFFRSLYPERELASLINALKSLQDNLGDFNDLEVQQATLRQFAQTMMVEKIGTASSLMAMGRLVEGLEHRQVEERQVFHRRFGRFSSRKNRQIFKTLFKPPETGRA